MQITSTPRRGAHHRAWLDACARMQQGRIYTRIANNVVSCTRRYGGYAPLSADPMKIRPCCTRIRSSPKSAYRPTGTLRATKSDVSSKSARDSRHSGLQ